MFLECRWLLFVCMDLAVMGWYDIRFGFEEYIHKIWVSSQPGNGIHCRHSDYSRLPPGHRYLIRPLRAFSPAVFSGVQE